MESIRTGSETVDAFATLSDDELVEQVKHLAACERRAAVALIRSLVEFDARRLYLREGCSSLFTYCTQVLHLSEGSAYNRIETARAARRYPKVLEALERGTLTLTAVRLLAPHLTPARGRADGRATQEQAGDSGADSFIESSSGGCDHHSAGGDASVESGSSADYRHQGGDPDTVGLDPSRHCVWWSRRRGASASAPRCRRDATCAGTRQAASDAVARDARKAAVRAGACQTYATGWRHRRDSRSRIDATDRPSRAA
jgi:hypothetical protein